MSGQKLTEGEPHPDCNGGQDTAEHDLVIYKDMVLVNQPESRKYKVHSLLGCGTFGQVVLCACLETGMEVAVKVIKNQTAYFNQAIFEAHVLKLLNHKHDPEGKLHIVRMYQYFTHANHLCIVFERLHLNLFEVLKLNHYNGLSLDLVCLITKQILECLCAIRKAGIIHCDLKPENVLLENTTGTDCKVIDFGSACFENNQMYSYIQSRFYRSPEVILRHSRYTCMVDMWSLGCLAAELFLGLPLYPGVSDYDMLRRICESVGAPGHRFLMQCRLSERFFTTKWPQDSFAPAMALMTQGEFESYHRTPAKIGRMYFRHLTEHPPNAPITLKDVILQYPIDSRLAGEAVTLEQTRRHCFLHFLEGILQIDPENRWTPWQALQHPFITDQPFMGTFTPPQEPREFAPHAHHPPATQHNQRPTHNFPSSMQTGISAVSGQPAYVQVSPFAATHSPFAANHTGSSHMGDTLSQPFNNLDLRSTPRSSGFTGDRSGIPATVFPMVGPCVSQGPGDSSFMSGSIANTSPMPSSRNLLTRQRHSSVNHTGELWAMSPRESGYNNRMDSHVSGPMYAQPMSLGHRHSTPAGLQPPAAAQYQSARSPRTQHAVPPLSLMGMQPRQSGDSVQQVHQWHRPSVGYSTGGSSYQGSPRVSLDAQNSSGVRRKGTLRRSQRRHSSSAIGFGDTHAGSQRSARLSRQSNSNYDAFVFRESFCSGQGEQMYQQGIECGPRAFGDDSPVVSPRAAVPHVVHRNLTMLTEGYAEGSNAGPSCGTMPQSWNSFNGATAAVRPAADEISCGSNMTTGSPRVRDACTSLQCLSVRQTPRGCGASMQHLYESGFLDHAGPDVGLAKSCRLQGSSDASDVCIDSFDGGAGCEGALRTAPQTVSQFVGQIGD